MNAVISLKSGSYHVAERETARTLYTIKKTAFKAGVFQLVNASKYKLYSLTHEQSTGKPSFRISNNGVALMRAVCNTMFLCPKITVSGHSTNGEEVSFTIESDDRRNFVIKNGDGECGHIKTMVSITNELQYDMDCDDKVFDDFIVFFAAIVDISYGHFNRENMS